MKIRLVYLITSLGVGGAEVGMLRLLRQVDHDRFDVTVVSLTSGDIEAEIPSHVAVHQLLPARPTDVSDTVAGLQAMRRADTMVCSLFHAAVLGALFDRLFDTPRLLIWQHSTKYFGRFRGRIYNRCYARADVVLADSSAVAASLSDRGVEVEKIETIPLAGIDLSRFTPVFGDDGGECRVATVGRLVPAKGYEVLLDCAELLGDGFEFHVAGDGPLRENLEDQLEDRDLENVLFHGELPIGEIPEFLSKADVYLQPSHAEGLCITVVEAMAAGLPVVGSDVDGITETVVDGETGFLVAPGDAEAFADRLESLCSDPGLRNRFGEQGRTRVETRYTISEIGDQFEEAVIGTERGR